MCVGMVICVATLYRHTDTAQIQLNTRTNVYVGALGFLFCDISSRDFGMFRFPVLIYQTAMNMHESCTQSFSLSFSDSVNISRIYLRAAIRFIHKSISMSRPQFSYQCETDLLTNA